MKDEEKLKELLKSQLAVMHRAAEVLQVSWEACQKERQVNTYPIEAIDQLELLSSRFSRLTDFMIQKILRLIDEIDLETPGTIRDTIYRAEKKGLITSSDQFIEARILRNKIAHEYADEVMTEIFQKAMQLVPAVLEAVKRVEEYVLRYQL